MPFCLQLAPAVRERPVRAFISAPGMENPGLEQLS